MKLLDRYVLWSFLRNYLISFMVLVGMFIMLDMVFNFDDLVRVRSDPATGSGASPITVLYNIGEYYFYRMFLMFNQLSGIIPVVAAAFTLMRLSRFNELTAVLAAGVPLLRVAMPIILAAVMLNGLLLVNQELVVPNMIHKVARQRDEMHDATAPGTPGAAAAKYEPIEAMQDENGALLWAGRYFAPAAADAAAATGSVSATMHTVDILRFNANFEPVEKITAESAAYDDALGGWRLRDVRVSALRDDQPPDAGGLRPTLEWRTNINPVEIALYRSGSGDFVEMLSTERINELLQRPKSYGTNHLLRVKHWRFTQPLMNVILLLLAIPAVLTREPGHLKTAATKCLLLTGLGMGSVFLANHVAGNPPEGAIAVHWPAILAWVPIFVFGPVSVFLLDRVKT